MYYNSIYSQYQSYNNSSKDDSSVEECNDESLKFFKIKYHELETYTEIIEELNQEV